MAPELISSLEISKAFGIECFDLKKSDIFSLGVALFTMVIGMPPFISANKYDTLYWWLFFKQKQDKFWKNQSSEKIESLSTEFKNLIEQMLHPDPN